MIADDMARKRLAKWVFLVAGTGVATVLIALAACWLTLEYIPAWYAPPELTERDWPRVRASLSATYQTFTDKLMEGQPFEFELEAATVNEWLAAREALWPESREALPPFLRDPVLTFCDGEARLGVRFSSGEIDAILSFDLRIESRNQELVVQLDRVAIGAWSLSRERAPKWLDDRIRTMSGQDAHRSERLAEQSPSIDADRPIQSLVEGITVENRFYWSNGGQYFRFDSLTTEDDRLHVKIEILPPPNPSLARRVHRPRTR